ncbi:hypothetical protein D3C78_1038090 [compost metagenome]
MLDRAADVGARAQAHREQAGEPADAAAQVEAVIDGFAAMPFELNQHVLAPAPGADDLCQGAEQKVVDLGAVGTRCVLQQLPGGLAVQTRIQG